jgi:hypothetical protein
VRAAFHGVRSCHGGALGNGSWGYIVGTYDKDAGRYLNGTRLAQKSDQLPVDLNSASFGIGRHVSGIAAPSNVAGAAEQEGGEPPPLAGAGVVVCLMG